MRPMRILVQQKETDLYFKDIDSWTADSSEAMDFVGSTAAIDFCLRNRLAEVQLVLKFDKEKCDIVMPVRTEGHLRGDRTGRSA